jgi:hypothetical protein
MSEASEEARREVKKRVRDLQRKQEIAGEGWPDVPQDVQSWLKRRAATSAEAARNLEPPQGGRFGALKVRAACLVREHPATATTEILMKPRASGSLDKRGILPSSRDKQGVTAAPHAPSVARVERV